VSSRYQIIDEPGRARWPSLPVRAFWPLLTTMLVGAGPGWCWFVVNAFAVGSPSRRRELAWVVGGLVVLSVLAAALIVNWPLVPPGVRPYLGLGLVVPKLGIAYRLYLDQARTEALFSYFGGTFRNGLPILAVGWLVIGRLPLPSDGFVALLLRLVLL
jgi:hypothetical protein